MKLLLDNHIWLWYALGNSQLSENLRSLIASNTTELWLSPISIWEVLLLVERGRIFLQAEPVQWINQSLDLLKVREAPLDRHIMILSRQIQLPHQDPADRFIAATAIHCGLPLATVDANLVSAPELTTIS